MIIMFGMRTIGEDLPFLKEEHHTSFLYSFNMRKSIDKRQFTTQMIHTKPIHIDVYNTVLSMATPISLSQQTTNAIK